MVLARVKGHVVFTAKVANLTGKKLLLVEILTIGEGDITPTLKHMVCVDAVGAGEGELVLAVQGSSARVAPGMNDVSTDAVIVGIVESVQAHGRLLQGTIDASV